MNSGLTNGRRSYDQSCPVAHALDVVGERWTLLIVRDLMFGPLRFGELREGLPGLAPNLLSERLRYLAEHGVVTRVPVDGSARTAYALTERGRALAPVIHEIARFGVQEWDELDDRPPPRRLLRGAVLALMRPDRLGTATWFGHLELAEGSVGVAVGPAIDTSTPLERLRLSDPVDESQRVDVLLRSELATLVALHRGLLDLDRAIADEQLELDGSQRAVTQLRRLMCWD